MIPLVRFLGDITIEDVKLFGCVCAYIRNDIPEYDSEPGPSCHDVCATVAAAFDVAFPGELVHVRGHFHAKGWDHSWLRIRGTDVIIDAYPWAGYQPALLYLGGMSPWRYIYLEQESEHDATPSPGV